MTLQTMHYDVYIHPSEQPACPRCEGHMHIRISPRLHIAEWSCLHSDCQGTVDHVETNHLHQIAAKNGWTVGFDRIPR